MTTFNFNKVSRSSGTAALPAAKRAQAGKGRAGRMVRRLASFPVSLDNWLSGPPLTNLERERATLAYVRNHQGSGTILG